LLLLLQKGVRITDDFVHPVKVAVLEDDVYHLRIWGGKERMHAEMVVVVVVVMPYVVIMSMGVTVGIKWDLSVAVIRREGRRGSPLVVERHDVRSYLLQRLLPR
jgi:hypothetical protein